MGWPIFALMRFSDVLFVMLVLVCSGHVGRPAYSTLWWKGMKASRSTIEHWGYMFCPI